jgi:hypothetical protein
MIAERFAGVIDMSARCGTSSANQSTLPEDSTEQTGFYRDWATTVWIGRIQDETRWIR